MACDHWNYFRTGCDSCELRRTREAIEESNRHERRKQSEAVAAEREQRRRQRAYRRAKNAAAHGPNPPLFDATGATTRSRAGVAAGLAVGVVLLLVGNPVDLLIVLIAAAIVAGVSIAAGIGNRSRQRRFTSVDGALCGLVVGALLTEVSPPLGWIVGTGLAVVLAVRQATPSTT